jgi:CheY-like chemotaxis protein
MQLILAIDADKRQAAQLAALVRGRFDAEFVQAESAGEALQVLAERVPDLIMTSPLLSPFDDGVLAEYLREIGPAGAHVQTLRIPVLGVAKPAGRGLFSFGRKRRNESAPDGCDPTFFADEIAVYLARAAEERQATNGSPEPRAAVPADAEPHEVTVTYVPAYEPESYTSDAATAHSVEYEFRDETPIYVAPAPPARDEESLDESAERHEDEPVLAYCEPDVAPPDAVTHCDPAPRPDAEQAPMYVEDASLQMLAAVDDQLDNTVAASASVPIDEPAAHIEQQDAVDEDMPVAIVYEMTDDVQAIVDEAPDVVATPIIVEYDLAPIEPREEPPRDHVEPVSPVAPPPPVAPPAPRRTASFEAALAAIRGAWGKKVRASKPSLADSEQPVAEQGQASTAPQMAEPVATSETPGETRGPLEVDLTCDIDALEEPEAETAVDAAPPEEDVYELNASPALHDLESALEAAAPPAAFVPNPLHEIAPAEPAPVEAHPAVNKEKPEKSRKRSDKKGPKKPSKSSTQPAQDEWGLFDPDRCGFAAVVQKLNEVTDDEDPKATRTSVRVISCR